MLSTYLDEMTPRQAQITRAMMRTGAMVEVLHGRPVSRSAASSLRRQAMLYRHLAATLKSVRPPVTLRPLHGDVTATLRSAAECLWTVRRGRSSDFRFEHRAMTNLSQALWQWDAALAAACARIGLPAPDWLWSLEQSEWDLANPVPSM